jgi:hypothetical protein
MASSSNRSGYAAVLNARGLIEQIPSMTYLVSLARSAQVKTAAGTYSVHHIQPAFFGGFEVLPDSGIKLALAEKALIDLLYLSPTRGRRFASLPEIELPRGFRRAEAKKWIGRIPSARLLTIVAQRFKEILSAS